MTELRLRTLDTSPGRGFAMQNQPLDQGTTDTHKCIMNVRFVKTQVFLSDKSGSGGDVQSISNTYTHMLTTSCRALCEQCCSKVNVSAGWTINLITLPLVKLKENEAWIADSGMANMGLACKKELFFLMTQIEKCSAISSLAEVSSTLQK